MSDTRDTIYSFGVTFPRQRGVRERRNGVGEGVAAEDNGLCCYARPSFFLRGHVRLVLTIIKLLSPCRPICII